MKKFIASTGVYTSSYRNVNYTGSADIPNTLKKVFAEFPNAIVVDGSDDWYASTEASPTKICDILRIKVLAYFQSGTSGIACSGVVVDPSDYIRMTNVYPMFNVRVYLNEAVEQREF